MRHSEGLAIAVGAVELAVAGAVIAVAGAMIPDWDTRMPGIQHRGITHTVWFALLVGVMLGAGGGDGRRENWTRRRARRRCVADKY